MQQPKWVPPLPPNWEGRFDSAQRRYFFINHLTKQTQWEDPRFQQSKPTPAAAAKSLSPTRDATQPSSRQAYQMQEISALRELESRSHDESSLSEEVDQAIVAKLMKEFPQAGKELIVDMMVSCHNNERETREQMKDIFGNSTTANRASSHHSSSTTSSQPQKQESVSQLSDAEKDRIITQICPLFPILPERIVRMAMDMVKYDTAKGKLLLQKLSEEEQEKKDTNAAGGRKVGSTSSTSSASSGRVPSPGSFLPEAFSDSASNRPQGFSSGAGTAPSSVASRIASTSGSGTRATVSPARQPQPINKAKQVTKMSEHLLNTTSDLLNHLTSTATPCCRKDGGKDEEEGWDDTSSDVNQILSRRSKVPPKKTAVTKQPHQAKTPDPSFLSSQRSSASGPDPSLSKGADASLLSSDMPHASGPDLTIRNGPNRSICAGPNRSHVCGSMGARGPDSSFRCGPTYSGLTSPSRVLVSHI